MHDLPVGHVQDLLADYGFLAIGEAYLKTTPKVDVVSMWWHTNFNEKPDSQAAQYYHFDMDRLNWLKVFIYLTDVSIDDGPHAFIAGSHKANGIPKEILQKGYQRISDKEVFSHYGIESSKIFTVPKGTILIEDTRGLHKGTMVQKNGRPRLILQFQMSSSLFGANYPKTKIDNIKSPKLEAMVRYDKNIYKNYLGKVK